MNQNEVTSFLMKILQTHGLAVTSQDDWVFIDGKLPAIKCVWNVAPDAQRGKLDVQVLIEKDTIIEECFAGIDAGDEGFKDSFYNFSLNTLPVLLAAFWNKNDAEQVVTKEWLFGTEKYTLFLGNIGIRSSSGVNPRMPEETLAAIEQALKNENISKEHYWARTFYCNVGNNDKMFEAMLNNQKWYRGEQTLRSLSWEASDGYYSVRHFLVLSKALDSC